MGSRFAATVLLACAACASAPDYTPAPADAGKRVVAERGAVTSANPLASEAGVAMLRAGGNAIDAAVATSFAIGVVEPQMSGLGGSGAMLIWRQNERAADHLDFYAAQPVAAFRRSNRGPADTTAFDMRIVAVPGAVAGLLEAHERYGRLPLAQVIAPAIRLAEEGFPVGQILAGFIESDSAKLHRFADSRTRMWPDGRPLPPGALLRNSELARTMRLIAERGRAGFYEGAVARNIVAAMNAGGHPLTVAELAGYEPQWKRPLCSDYRGHTVLGAPPPQTGAQVMHTLNLLEPHALAQYGLPTESPRAFDVLVSALRVAMADNRATNDDPRWESVVAHGRTTDEFARERAALVGASRAPARIETASAQPFETTAAPAACAAFRPWPAVETSQDIETPVESQDTGGETTHISVVDGEGNAVALTQTNSTTFGSGAWVEGFFLNDSGFRFDSASLAATSAAAYRTRTSTIAPTIVLENGRVKMVTGAPGSGRIPTEIVQTMVYVLDYGMDPLDALRMPRIYPSPNNATVQLEQGFAPALLRAAREMGYDPTAQSSSYARLYMIVRAGDRWIAVADPRHDGAPRGW